MVNYFTRYLATSTKKISNCFVIVEKYFQKSVQFNLNLEAPLIKYISIKSKQGN